MKPKTILIADRDPSFAFRLHAALSSDDVRVVTASDVTRGFDAFRQEDPDLVILSVDLPSGGGLRLHEQIRRRGDGNRPLIYLAESADDPRQHRARYLGAAAFLERPAEIDDLLDTVRELLSRPPGEAPARVNDGPLALRRGGSLRILVVDGDPRERARVQQCLHSPRRDSIDPVFASSVQEAVRFIQRYRYDCVLLAHRLPDGTGLELLEEVDEQLLTTPVITLVDTNDDAVAVEYFRAGCLDVLPRAEVLCADRLRRAIARTLSGFHRRVMAAIIERRQLSDAITESQEGLITLARTDRLMGICNRAVFDEYLPVYHAETADVGGSYALCMIDVDRFKAYNDHYGHAAGDQALRRVAQTLGKSLRSNDFIARYGGEEVVVVLDAVTAQTLRPVADRLRKRVFDEQIPHVENGPTGRITVSIGVALFESGSGETPAAVLSRADEALYQAKEAGRNQVVVAPAATPAKPLTCQGLRLH